VFRYPLTAQYPQTSRKVTGITATQLIRR